MTYYTTAEADRLAARKIIEAGRLMLMVGYGVGYLLFLILSPVASAIFKLYWLTAQGFLWFFGFCVVFLGMSWLVMILVFSFIWAGSLVGYVLFGTDIFPAYEFATGIIGSMIDDIIEVWRR